jgi:hypothetical protein
MMTKKQVEKRSMKHASKGTMSRNYEEQNQEMVAKM